MFVFVFVFKQEFGTIETQSKAWRKGAGGVEVQVPTEGGLVFPS